MTRKIPKKVKHPKQKLDFFPVLPFEPDEFVCSQTRIFEQGDFDSDEAIAALVSVLWSEPETVVYYYRAKDAATDFLLARAEKAGVITIGKIKRHYYKHPGFHRDYIRVMQCDGNCSAEKSWYGRRTPECDGKYCWRSEKEALEKGPEFLQIHLLLSNHAREELNIRRRIEIESDSPNNTKEHRRTVLGRNIDTLRLHCGWSFELLAEWTKIDKKLILGHVNHGKGANPATLKIYADAFSKRLNRTITVNDLLKKN